MADDRRITIEAPAHAEESALGALSMAGFDAVEIERVGSMVHVHVYWAPEAGPPPEIDLRRVPGGRRLSDTWVSRASWTDGWPSFVVGPLVIAPPSDDAAPADFGPRLPVLIEAGVGFGHGEHPSTRLALEAMVALPRPIGPRVIDVGCGTGVLGLAALRLGAEQTYALDEDPVAVATTRNNAARNGLELWAGASWPTAPADLVLANITPPALIALAERISACVRRGGRLILAGLPESQAAQVAARYPPFAVRAEHRAEGWVALTLS